MGYSLKFYDYPDFFWTIFEIFLKNLMTYKKMQKNFVFFEIITWKVHAKRNRYAPSSSYI